MRRNYKTLGGLLAGLLLMAAILFGSIFGLSSNLKAISCGDTVTTCLSNMIVSGSTILTSATITTLNSGGQTASAGATVMNATDVALTSPTVTFSATGLYYINLSANANLTNIYPLNGTAGQVLRIHAANGAGTNTMGFVDNASTMSLGTNRSLTEGNNSFIELVCHTAGARPQWYSTEFQAN